MPSESRERVKKLLRGERDFVVSAFEDCGDRAGEGELVRQPPSPAELGTTMAAVLARKPSRRVMVPQ